jgi:hypothetical protein
MYISNLTNQGAKRLLRKFWGLSDTLHYDIDKIPFDVFSARYSQLLDMLERVGKMEGHPITVNLNNLIEKARGKYGWMFDNKFSEVEENELVF